MKYWSQAVGRFLVTGGAGFIGSHLVESLVCAGHKVNVLDDMSTGKRENLAVDWELIVGDVADVSVLDRAIAECDGVYHLAAIASVQSSNENWLATHRVNQTGSIAVFDAARRHSRLPVVYASSAAVYGDAAETPLTEFSPVQPLTAYGADKLGTELHAHVASHVHGVPTAGMRFFNVYGPKQDPRSPYSGVISIFADNIHSNKPLIFFGDGLQTRDFIFVSDVVEHLISAMDLLLATPQSLITNVCTGRPTSLRELSTTLGHITGKSPELQFSAPRQGDIRNSLGSPTYANERYGLKLRVSLADGLAMTIANRTGRASGVVL